MAEMPAYQVKVFYGDGFKKCGMFFLSYQEYMELNYEMLTTRVKEVTRAFQHVSSSEIRIRYLDDEDCFVNFEETLTHELFRCAKEVPGADWRRITLQAEMWNSPAPKCTSLKNKQRHFQEKDLEIDSNGANYCPTKKIKDTTYSTPVERLVSSKQEEIRKQQEQIKRKSSDIIALEQAFSSVPIDTTRPACSKCHLRAGHTRLNCPNEMCASARFCGDIKRHVEEKKQLKDLKSDLQLMRSKLKKMEDELANLCSSINSSKRTFAQLIHTNLVNSDRDKYLYSNGAIDWLKLNTDAKKIEKICEGKVPGPNTDLQALVAQHDASEKLLTSTNQYERSSNPVKRLWEQKGVKFPGTAPIYWSPLPKAEKALSVPIPETKEEEEYQVDLAIRESQFTAASYTDTPLNTPVKTSTVTSTHSNLDTLAKAATYMSKSLTD